MPFCHWGLGFFAPPDQVQHSDPGHTVYSPMNPSAKGCSSATPALGLHPPSGSIHPAFSLLSPTPGCCSWGRTLHGSLWDRYCSCSCYPKIPHFGSPNSPTALVSTGDARHPHLSEIINTGWGPYFDLYGFLWA